MRAFLLLTTLALCGAPAAQAQRTTTTRPDSTSAALAPRVRYVPKSSHADTLRGSFTTPGRRWWDVTFYDLHVDISPRDSSIRGYNRIEYTVLAPAKEMQIDLMTPLDVDSMVQDGKRVVYRRDGNAFVVTLNAPQVKGQHKNIAVYYHGQPQVAKNPPWQGGFSWAQDSLGRPWVVTTDQGMGASVWWPNKDTQADEPDSQRVMLTLPDPMIDVSNGRLRSTTKNANGTTTYEWFVTNPINNYAIAVAGGHYAHYSEVYDGVKGKLTMDFWPLDYNVDNAHRQWVQARSMMQCFEHWFGPYPWYEDGYKLLEVPNTGMEHQSAVSYGNWFQNGYRKRDGSGTGLGLKWDFIIVHESAHEWFGNNITAKDNADMWVHESFANYAEGIYTECQFGKEAGAQYIIGNRRGIRNDRPIIPAYDVNDQGSGDMYPKGGEMLHTIREIVGNDEKWRGILTGLNKTFWHQTVMGSQVEHYISEQAGVKLDKVFDQYLRTIMIPSFEYHVDGNTLSYRWNNVVPGFDMPLDVTLGSAGFARLHPTTSWQKATLALANGAEFKVDANFYVTSKVVDATQPSSNVNPSDDVHVRVALTKQPFLPSGVSPGPNTMANGGIQPMLAQMGAVTRVSEARLTAAQDSEYGGWKKLGYALGQFANIVRDNVRDGWFTVGLYATCPSMPGMVAGLQHASPGAKPLRVGMLWLDAHPDFNTPETTRSGSLGGMPVAVATGRALRNLRLDAGLDPPLDDRFIVMGGVRLTDPLEQQLLDRSHIQQVTVDDLRHASPAVFAQLDRLNHLVDRIYVHIDMDVLDPREVMGHVNKVPNGPSSTELAALFEQIFRRYPKAVAIGFATIPDKDDGGLSLAAVNRMIVGAVKGVQSRTATSAPTR